MVVRTERCEQELRNRQTNLMMIIMMAVVAVVVGGWWWRWLVVKMVMGVMEAVTVMDGNDGLR